jgi:hypothetical protein
MTRNTTVKRHSRKGTRGVKQHTREIESPFDKCVPHDVDLNIDEEKSEDEEKDQTQKDDEQDGLLDKF